VFTLEHKKTNGPASSYRYGGIQGISVLVKDSLSTCTKIVKETLSENTLWLFINDKSCGIHMIVGSIYIPHENSVHHHNEIFDNIAHDLIFINSKFGLPVVLLGDFNARTGNQDDFVTIDNTVAFATGIDITNNEVYNTQK